MFKTSMAVTAQNHEKYVFKNCVQPLAKSGSVADEGLEWSHSIRGTEFVASATT